MTKQILQRWVLDKKRKKREFFIIQTKWLKHEKDEKGTNPKEEKAVAILKLKTLNNTKELKSFLGAMQNLTKVLPNLSEITNRLRKILKKKEP